MRFTFKALTFIVHHIRCTLKDLSINIPNYKPYSQINTSLNHHICLGLKKF